MNLKQVSLFDFVLFFATLILLTIGILFIYSSGINSEGILVSNEYLRQILFASTSLLLLIAMSIIDYRRLLQLSGYIYAALIIMLLYTRFFGRYVNGARSWLGIGNFGIQPSQLGVVAFIIFLAWYLQASERTTQLKRFLVATLIMAVPVLLILSQPDLGTAIVYIPIFLVLCFVADIPLRYIGMLFFTGILTLLFVILPIWERVIYKDQILILRVLTNLQVRMILITCLSAVTIISLIGLNFLGRKYFYWLSYFFSIVTVSLTASIVVERVLQEYQVMRLIVFLDPNVDRLGAGWNIIQSKVAIGSGSFFGKGFLNGTQSHYRFLPEQSTDFIFSILSEEWGFFGGMIIFSLYLLILLRGLSIMKATSNRFGYYLAMGIVFMFFFYFLINVGMVMGIMPVIGLPLLLVSYGGSSVWTAMISIGILESIHIRRLDF